MDERVWCPTIADTKDLVVTATGDTERDYTVASRCRMRLTTKRGHWPYDPELGSRFHELRTLEQAQARAGACAQEALEPLIAEGAIVSVKAGQIEVDPRTGMVGVELFVELPHAEDGELLSVGTYRLGV